MKQSAEWDPARADGEFFADPQHPSQRRYEALRAYLYEGYSATEVAEWFGYSIETVRTLVRDFRAGRTEFFVDPKPGPKHAPAKEAARDRVVELRRDHKLSIDEIAAVLGREGTPLNRTGISEIIAAEGLPRLWRRPAAERGVRRIGHVEDIAADPGAGLFAGLSTIPKTTALRTYSYQLDHPCQQRFLAALSKAMVGHGMVGADFALDFHAIQHWGQEPTLEKHYVPKRSQRTRSVLNLLRPRPRHPQPHLRQRRHLQGVPQP